MPDPEVGLQVEQPRLRVTIDGIAVPGAVYLEVESFACFSADRFRIGFAVGAGGLTSIGFFAAVKAQRIEIELALANFGFVTILVGQIDNVRLDLAQDLATLSGRDLSALLIDTEIAETFVNQTSAQIAETIAARHGLTPVVTPTASSVGQYYEIDHARYALGVNARATNEWSLLAWLAQMEGFSLSVIGTTLAFGPAAPVAPMFLTPGSMMTLTVDVATTIPTQAVVKSWNSRNKTVVTQMEGDAGGLLTTLVRPNLTAVQAGAAARTHLSALNRHGTVLTATMPGELILAPENEIILVGTDSMFDQTYRIDAISRSVDCKVGFVQTIRAYADAG